MDKAIDYFFSSHPLRRPASICALHVRRKLFDRFMEIMKPEPHFRILDVGVTPDDDLPDSNFFEAFYPYRHRLIASGIEDASRIEALFPGVKFVLTEKDRLPFKNGAFDVAFCSAVLEHAGSRSQQRRFVHEVLRVAKHFFFTTPNRQFPVEFHTFLPLIHWLPRAWHQSILNALGLHFWAQTANLNLLTPRDLRSLFPNDVKVSLRRQKLLGIPSNLIAYG